MSQSLVLELLRLQFSRPSQLEDLLWHIKDSWQLHQTCNFLSLTSFILFILLSLERVRHCHYFYISIIILLTSLNFWLVVTPRWPSSIFTWGGDYIYDDTDWHLSWIKSLQSRPRVWFYCIIGGSWRRLYWQMVS